MKSKFIKMYNELPKKARKGLVYDFINNPMTLEVCFYEIKNNTKLSKKILRDLGYEDKKLCLRR